MSGTGTPRKSQSGAQPSPIGEHEQPLGRDRGADLGKLAVEGRDRRVAVAHLGVDALRIISCFIVSSVSATLAGTGSVG